MLLRSLSPLFYGSKMLAQQLKSILPYIARYEQQIALSWLSLPKELRIGFIPEVIYRFTATRREKSMPYARSCAIDQLSRFFALPTGYHRITLSMR